MSHCKSQEHFETTGLEVAIIGMSGRFPGAKNIEQFWQNLCDGVESISFFTDQELVASGIPSNILNDPDYVKARGILEKIEWFDASFFEMSPKEVQITDPQQRIFLECAWEALENAGYNTEMYNGSIGVYGGQYTNTYMLNLLSNPHFIESIGDFLINIGNEKDYLATRVAYKLNLKGPAVNVQSACSTSLVAVHLACQSLLSGACDMALAGGVAIRAQQTSGYFYKGSAIYSPDGHCRTFDEKAEGSVSSNGIGIVVLKRLEDALADGDYIHAVIRGSAINNDAALRVGFTAPGIDGQAKVIRMAQIMAEVEPEMITYVETHGSGTALGDPIEIKALTQAFRLDNKKKRFCAIGSVKTNIGHTHTAAGVAGLIKTVLALKHKLIPPSLNFKHPNPKIDFENSPFYVNTKLSEWKTNQTARIAGVSSFGIGGTNAHVIVQEPPPRKPTGKSRSWQLVILSAKTKSALETTTSNLVEHFKQFPTNTNFADAVYTLQVGRRTFEYKYMAVCQSLEDAMSALEKRDPKRLLSSVQETNERPVVFMFPGLGDHYINMALGLYQSEPVFREHIDRCSTLLKPHLGVNISSVLYPPSPKATDEKTLSNPITSQHSFDLRQMLGHNKEKANQVTQQFDQTRYAQPILFTVEYALAQLLIAWGIRPQAMIGYSIGEYVAACLAGVLTLEDALLLIAERARMIQELPYGSMLAIPLPQDKVTPLLNDKLSIAAINGPSICVISGPLAAIAEMESYLEEEGLAYRRLQTTHAFHSKMMEPISKQFIELVKKLSLSPPQIPYISTVTGDWVKPADATNPAYWAHHMCQPVTFSEGIEKLWQVQGRVLIEIGPGQSLSSLALQHPASTQAKDPIVLSSMRHLYNQQPDSAFLLNMLGKLWLAGFPLDWVAFHASEQRQRIPLPTYPFERQRYWIEPSESANRSKQPHDFLQKKSDISDWFYIPLWKRTLGPTLETDSLSNHRSWLIFADKCGLAKQIKELLKQDGQTVITVIPGEHFNKLQDGVYTINPRHCDEYDILIQELCQLDKLPQTIIHAWSVTSNTIYDSGLEFSEQMQSLGFYSLIFLVQALSNQGITDPLHISVISNNMQAVTDEGDLYPEKATLLGPCKVIPQEHSNITCCSIDVILPESGSWQEIRLVNQIIAQITQPSELTVAFRGQHRWVPTFDAVRLENVNGRPRQLREGGVYLITGGLGSIGFVLAKYLSETVTAKLILIGRSTLPPREAWEQWLITHDEQNNISRKIRKVQTLENLGSEIIVAKANVTDQDQMQDIVNKARLKFGKIHGVIHAAGVPGGGMIQFKHLETANSVLAPKVNGTLILDAIFKNTDLDFLVLCSSTISITGGFGQVDYCAANAFLDAFAQANGTSATPFIATINWDAWQEVGMAYDIMHRDKVKKSRQPTRTEFIDHPLLDKCLLETLDEEIYVTKFSATNSWIVNEHIMNGLAVLPGTAYLEMVRAACEKHAQGRFLELSHVLFFNPMVVNSEREVYLVIKKHKDIFNFSFISKVEAIEDQAPQWLEYVSGRATFLDQVSHKRHDLQQIIAKGHLTKKKEEEITHLGPMNFGPRSQCLSQVYVGTNEAIAYLELSERFSADLENLKLHPSLMDIATGFLNLYLSQDFYMPLTYEKLKIKGPLSGNIYSYLRFKGPDSAKETMTFDIIITDDTGIELVEIEEFTMKKVADLDAALKTFHEETGLLTDDKLLITNEAITNEAALSRSYDNPFQKHLEKGILSREGEDAFARIISQRGISQVIVATKDLQAMVEDVNAFTPPDIIKQTERPQAVASTYPRPNLKTAYVAPRNELEQHVAKIWQELLGIKYIGIYDNFFDLGGHSLLGIQLASRLSQAFKVDIPLRSLFEALTVSELAMTIEALVSRQA